MSVFETAAAALSDIVVRCALGTLTQGEATVLIQPILEDLWPDQFLQLDDFRQALGRREGVEFTTGVPSNLLGVEGSAAVDLLNGRFYGPKTNEGWGTGRLIWGSSIDLMFSFAGQALPSEVLTRVEVSKAFTVKPADCRASCETAPLSSAVFNLTFNGVAIGSVTFGSGQTSGVFSFSTSPTSLGAGLLRIIAPAVPGGIADISITLSGDRN